jgi:hypothetical protein
MVSEHVEQRDGVYYFRRISGNLTPNALAWDLLGIARRCPQRPPSTGA